jgi:hypothetical protein
MRRFMAPRLAASLCVLAVSAVAASGGLVQPPAATAPETTAYQGPELERFLLNAAVVKMKSIGRGVTLPQRATLTLDGTTHDGAWKTIDESKSGVTQLSGGQSEIDFEDTYRAECAAYQLDRLLALDMVPATVERVINGKRGSLQFWIAPNIPEAERYKKKLQPPDVEAWNRQMFKVRVFDNLIYNTDRNLNNILITPEWQIRLIDHSRAFRKQATLRDVKSLTRFSRSLLDSMKGLTEPVLEDRLGRYINIFQIRGLLQRRDKIVELAARLAAERGEAAVYYP